MRSALSLSPPCLSLLLFALSFSLTLARSLVFFVFSLSLSLSMCGPFPPPSFENPTPMINGGLPIPPGQLATPQKDRKKKTEEKKQQKQKKKKNDRRISELVGSSGLVSGVSLFGGFGFAGHLFGANALFVCGFWACHLSFWVLRCLCFGGCGLLRHHVFSIGCFENCAFCRF